jgi:hypothetical protein
VTGETKSSTEPWIESKGVQYAYAYDKGRQLGNRLGVGGIPHAYLINPLGCIVWEGHPGALDDGIIRKHLAGTLSLGQQESKITAEGLIESPSALRDRR